MNDRETNDHAKALVREAWASTEKWASLYDEAVALLRPLAGADDASSETLTNYGAILSDIGQHAAAERFLRRAEACGSSYRNTSYNLAVALMNLARRPEARPLFEKAVKMAKEDDPTIQAYFDPQGY